MRKRMATASDEITGRCANGVRTYGTPAPAPIAIAAQPSQRATPTAPSVPSVPSPSATIAVPTTNPKNVVLWVTTV
jgi:hypothetical protein